MVCLVSSSTEQKIIWRQIGFPSLRSERARYYMTELQKFNENINLTIEGTCYIWLYEELHEESNGVFRFFVYQAENNLQTNWISVFRLERARYQLMQFQKFNKNIYLTIKGIWCTWIYAEMHEESNGVFSLLIYQAENNLKTNWFSVTQMRTRALLYEGIAKIQQNYKFNDWRDKLYMIVWRIARGIEWCV